MEQPHAHSRRLHARGDAARHSVPPSLFLTGSWHEPVVIALTFVLLTTIALAVLCLERPVRAPVRPARASYRSGTKFDRGDPHRGRCGGGGFELLLFLPLMVVGPFFFLGLRFRVALMSVLLMLASFSIAALVAGLAVPFVARAAVFLALCIVACAVSARHFDRWCRTSFLESRLITELVELDPLTGAKNRRVFDEQLARLWQQAIEDRRPLAVLLIDVDHFKAFNDRYGHQAGDQALRRVAHALKALIQRPLDVVTRYGGEEFAALLYDVNAAQAGQIAEQMRRAVTRPWHRASEHRARAQRFR